MVESHVKFRLLLATLLLLPAGLLLPTATCAQGDAWAKSYGERGGQCAWSIQLTSDGGYAVAGWTRASGAGEADFWVLKLTADGTIEWEKIYGGIADDLADLIFQTSDGGYVVTGTTQSFGAGAEDVWVLRLTADGTVLWAKTYGGTGEDEAVSIQQTTDGGYVVAGETESFGAGDWDLWILKLDAQGAIQWEKTYGGSDWETSSADPIQQTSDGGYVVCGLTASFGAGGSDVWVLKLDAQGAIQWQKTYGTYNWEMSHAIRQTLDGGYAVAGYTWSSTGDADVWILKLAANGTVQWQKTWGGREEDRAWSIWETSDGGCVATGNTMSFGGGANDAWVLKLGADGAVQWQKTYGGHAYDVGESVRQTSDGGYVVAGCTESVVAGDREMWLLRLDGDGDIPGCPFVRTPRGTVYSPSIAGVNSRARVLNSRAIVKDTHITAASPSSTVRVQCVHETTPVATGTPTPTTTLTATPTRTNTPMSTVGPSPTGARHWLFLPVIVK